MKWHLYPDEKPAPNQLVIFRVKSERDFFNGKWLGGKYLQYKNFGEFSTPDKGFDADLWTPMPLPTEKQYHELLNCEAKQ